MRALAGRWPPSDATGSPACVQSACLLRTSCTTRAHCHQSPVVRLIDRSIDGSIDRSLTCGLVLRRRRKSGVADARVEWTRTRSGVDEWALVQWTAGRSLERHDWRMPPATRPSAQRHTPQSASPARVRVHMCNSERLSALTRIVACRLWARWPRRSVRQPAPN